MKRRFLVLYDYGQGGVWRYVLAASKKKILEKFPELKVVDQVPSWMSNDFRKRIEGHPEDIDDPGEGLLRDILNARTK